MKSWEWWVPYVAAFLGWLGTYLLNKRSDTFKELTEVKNAYKELNSELSKRIETLETNQEKNMNELSSQKKKISFQEGKITELEKAHEGCQSLLESTNQALEYAKKQGLALFKLLKDNGHPGEAPI